MHHGQVVELNPELTNTVGGAPCCDAAARDWQYTSNPQLGGNVRWTLGSNFVLNGTVKPDFSQVEADATQIAADERFALFYPEKRPFFVEALDQFNVPNTLVYTRTIVQPDGGGEAHRQARARRRRACCRRSTSAGSATDGERPLVDIVRAAAELRRAVAGRAALQRPRRRRARRIACSARDTQHRVRRHLLRAVPGGARA